MPSPQKGLKTVVKDAHPLLDVCDKTSCGANTSVNVAKAISGFKGCNAATEKLPGVLCIIKDGALAVKETESVDKPENSGVQTTCEAVSKINDKVGDGIMIVMASV